MPSATPSPPDSAPNGSGVFKGSCCPQGTDIALSVNVASNTSFLGQVGQVTPSAGSLGSPFFANAPMLFIIAFDKARRPALLAVPPITLPNSEGPKLPNTKGRSKAWAAP